MRGVDSTSIYFNFQPGVGVYVDDGLSRHP